jgi:hypothetical protein
MSVSNPSKDRSRNGRDAVTDNLAPPKAVGLQAQVFKVQAMIASVG